VIEQEAKMLADYLTSYQFAQGQRVALSNHLESITDKNLGKLLQAEFKRKRQLEERLLSGIKAYIAGHPKLQDWIPSSKSPVPQ